MTKTVGAPLALKRRLAQTLRRVHWLASITKHLARLVRARFTSGVVGVILNAEGEVLLVEHVFHPQFPWGLPGGWLEGREAPDKALQREVAEELGLSITVLRPLLIEVGHEYRTHIDIALLCRADGHVRHLNSEVLDYRWVNVDALPPMMPFHRAAVEAARTAAK